MSSIAKFRAVIVGLMLLVYVAFLAVVVMSASASAAVADAQYENNRMHVTVDGDEITVHYEGDEPVVVEVEAVEGTYAGEGTYRLDPGDTLRLPYPEEPVTVRVTADSEHATVTALVEFDYVEIQCGDETARHLVPTEITYEWEVERDGRTRSGTRHVELAPSDVTCPEPRTAPGTGPSNADSRDEYNETHEDARDRYNETYDDARGEYNETYGEARGEYNDTHDGVMGLYERAHEEVWNRYEQVTNVTDDEPPDALGFADQVHEDAENFADQVHEDAEAFAGQVHENAENFVEQVVGDAQDDAERVKQDAENDTERVEDELPETPTPPTPPETPEPPATPETPGGGDGDSVDAWADADAERDGTNVSVRAEGGVHAEHGDTEADASRSVDASTEGSTSHSGLTPDVSALLDRLTSALGGALPAGR